MNDIVDAINNSTDPFIVVADDVNSEYLSSHITSMVPSLNKLKTEIMKRYIFASVSATDQISLPADKILGLDTTDAESLVIHFAGLGDQDNQELLILRSRLAV